MENLKRYRLPVPTELQGSDNTREEPQNLPPRTSSISRKREDAQTGEQTLEQQRREQAQQQIRDKNRNENYNVKKHCSNIPKSRKKEKNN